MVGFWISSSRTRCSISLDIFCILFMLNIAKVDAHKPKCEIPSNTTVQWVIDKCISNLTQSASYCYTPKGSDLNCVGIKNSENCSKAVTSLHLDQKAKLEDFNQSSFSYSVDNNFLCLHPIVTFTEAGVLLFGVDLDIEFYQSDDPDNVTNVHLGAIFPSGVSDAHKFQSSVVCVAKPPHIPYSNVSFFVSTGYSIPMKMGAKRTSQTVTLSLGSLNEISLDDTEFTKDYFNQSQPNIQFPDDYCPAGEDDDEKETWKKIHVVIIAILVTAVTLSLVIIVLWKRCCKKKEAGNDRATGVTYQTPETLNIDT